MSPRPRRKPADAGPAAGRPNRRHCPAARASGPNPATRTISAAIACRQTHAHQPLRSNGSAPSPKSSVPPPPPPLPAPPTPTGSAAPALAKPIAPHVPGNRAAPPAGTLPGNAPSAATRDRNPRHTGTRSDTAPPAAPRAPIHDGRMRQHIGRRHRPTRSPHPSPAEGPPAARARLPSPATPSPATPLPGGCQHRHLPRQPGRMGPIVGVHPRHQHPPRPLSPRFSAVTSPNASCRITRNRESFGRARISACPSVDPSSTISSSNAGKFCARMLPAASASVPAPLRTGRTTVTAGVRGEITHFVRHRRRRRPVLGPPPGRAHPRPRRPPRLRDHRRRPPLA